MHPEEALTLTANMASDLGAATFDILCSVSRSTGVELFESKVTNTDLSDSQGIGIRLFSDGRPGYASSERFTEAAIRQMVQDAWQHAQLAEPVPVSLPAPEMMPQIDLELYSDSTSRLTAENLISMSLELEQAAKAMDPRIINIPYLGYSTGSTSNYFANSLGIHMSESANHISGGLGVVAADPAAPDIRKMGYYVRGSIAPDGFDARAIAAEAVERAVSVLGASPVRGGVYTVVFRNRVASSLFGMFSQVFYADTIQKKQSRLADKIGKRIAAPIINLICDPHIPGRPGSRLMDSEGVVCKRTEIISGGVFVQSPYNLEAAGRDGVEPTGHGSRSFGGRAGTSFSNLLMECGHNSTDDLLQGRVLLVDRLEGASGVSAVSGDISIGAQGFLYESGRMLQPVDGITLNTNFFDLLMNIEAISESWPDSFSSVRIPDIRVSGVHVAGI